MTGATGVIGRAVTLGLLRDGHTVTAWTRSPAKAHALLGPEVARVSATGGDAALVSAVGAADAVVDLAGEPIGGRWMHSRWRRIDSSRIAHTRRVAAAFAAAPRPPSVLVSASGAHYYGDRGHARLDESSGRGDGKLAELFERWERAARAAEAAGARVVTLRTGVVLDAEGGALARVLPAFRVGLGAVIGSGRQYIPWIHLDDLVDIVLDALADPRYRGALNAVAPEPVTARDLARAIARTTRKPVRLRIPESALRLAFGEAATALTASLRVEPARLRELGHAFAFERVDRALADIVGSERDVDIAPVRHPPDVEYLRRRPPTHRLAARTLVGATLDQVFDFFADAENLSVMTPPSLGFEILAPTPVEMTGGTVIDYRIRLGPIPMRWRTVIAAWEPGVRFADAQERGPYRSWFHEHRFSQAGAHTWMEDTVHFAAPLGLLGRIVARLVLAPKLRRIFAYRQAAIRRRFGASAPSVRELERPGATPLG